MARLDPSISQKLFIPIVPRLDYGGDMEMPGIPSDDQFNSIPVSPRPPSIDEVVMKHYDTLIYPRLQKIFKSSLPAFSERDFNYDAIKNLATSQIRSSKGSYALMLRKKNWTAISDFLTLYVANTVINKYMRLKSNKMAENENRYGIEQYSYGVSGDTGVFPVDGLFTEIPNNIDFSRPMPKFPYKRGSWDKPEQSKAANGKGL